MRQSGGLRRVRTQKRPIELKHSRYADADAAERYGSFARLRIPFRIA
jgi:hypothetical protein